MFPGIVCNVSNYPMIWERFLMLELYPNWKTSKIPQTIINDPTSLYHTYITLYLYPNETNWIISPKFLRFAAFAWRPHGFEDGLLGQLLGRLTTVGLLLGRGTSLSDVVFPTSNVLLAYGWLMCVKHSWVTKTLRCCPMTITIHPNVESCLDRLFLFLVFLLGFDLLFAGAIAEHAGMLADLRLHPNWCGCIHSPHRGKLKHVF